MRSAKTVILVCWAICGYWGFIIHWSRMIKA